MTEKKTTGKASGKAGAQTKSASNALSVKRQLRRTRPVFTRHRPDRKAKLDDRWKKPRGLHNKLKDRKRGCLPWVSDGYRTPQEVRGHHISGLAIAHVASSDNLKGIDPKITGVVVSAVGAKKQIEILRECDKLGIKVLNHDAKKRVEELESKFKKSKEEKEKAREESKKKAAARDKQKEKKAAKEAQKDELSDEEKKEQEDKIKEEVLTSKNQ